jgi:hypothetical protein
MWRSKKGSCSIAFQRLTKALGGEQDEIPTSFCILKSTSPPEIFYFDCEIRTISSGSNKLVLKLSKLIHFVS